jgi:hypothetical protein
VDVSQAEITSLKPVCQPGVIQPFHEAVKVTEDGGENDEKIKTNNFPGRIERKVFQVWEEG